jgi:putative SOS response-associated peptidase YedK
MCGRFTFQPTKEFYQRFHIVNRLEGLVARYNIAPGQMVPVIISQSPKRVMLMRWGLIPHWAKDEKTAYKMINARMETLTQKPTFQSLLASNRCLVPADGFKDLFISRAERLLNSIKDYKMAAVIIGDMRTSEVAPIFERINSRGRNLEMVDLMRAATWKEGEDAFDLNTTIQSVREVLEGYQASKRTYSGRQRRRLWA